MLCQSSKRRQQGCFHGIQTQSAGPDPSSPCCWIGYSAYVLPHDAALLSRTVAILAEWQPDEVAQVTAGWPPSQPYFGT